MLSDPCGKQPSCVPFFNGSEGVRAELRLHCLGVQGLGDFYESFLGWGLGSGNLNPVPLNDSPCNACTTGSNTP